MLFPVDELLPTLPKNRKNGNNFELFSDYIMREYQHPVESHKAVLESTDYCRIPHKSARLPFLDDKTGNQFMCCALIVRFARFP